MNVQQLINNITPDIYESLKRAIELGKWADGKKLTTDQRQLCMQAVIAYEHKHYTPEQRTGYIPPDPHTFCGHDDESNHADQDKPIKWVE